MDLLRTVNLILRTLLNSKYGTFSPKVKTFPFAFKSRIKNNINLSVYVLFLGYKPSKTIMFNLSSTADSSGNCKSSLNSHCISFPKHTQTDDLGHRPQSKI